MLSESEIILILRMYRGGLIIVGPEAPKSEIIAKLEEVKVCVCKYVCVRACGYVCVHVCVCVFVFVFVYVYVCLHMSRSS